MEDLNLQAGAAGIQTVHLRGLFGILKTYAETISYKELLPKSWL